MPGARNEPTQHAKDNERDRYENGVFLEWAGRPVDAKHVLQFTQEEEYEQYAKRDRISPWGGPYQQEYDAIDDEWNGEEEYDLLHDEMIIDKVMIPVFDMQKNEAGKQHEEKRI